MVTEKGWRGQTRAQNEMTYRLFVECCGDRPVETYTRHDTAAFYGMLRKLPSLYAKDVRWRGMSLKQIIGAAENIAVDRLAMKTVRRHFSALGPLFEHLMRHELHKGPNPA
jgi:hypothetical protein